jgi:hypothetical protein
MVPALFVFAFLVTDVRGLIDRHDFAGAERTVRAYRARTGAISLNERIRKNMNLPTLEGKPRRY